VTIPSSPSVNSGITSIPYENADGTTGTYQFSHLNYAPATAIGFEYGVDFATGATNVALTRFFTWTGTTSTKFGVATNWNDSTDGKTPSAVVPGTLDFVTFSGAGGTLAGAGSVYVLDFRGGGSWKLAANTTLSASESAQLGLNGTGTASLTVGTTATINSRGFIEIAATAGNVDTLSITAGGVVRQTGPGITYTHAMSIGSAGASGTLAAANGTVLVSGAGSLLDLGANALTVAANGGTGTLNVTLGGAVDAATADTSLSAAVSIANSAGNGSVLVSGAGSILTANGYLLDGRGGTGSLIIQNSGSVVVNDAPLNASGIGIGAGQGAGPSSSYKIGGSGVATVTSGGLLKLNSTVSGIVVGGNGVNGALMANGGTVLTGAGLTVGTATLEGGITYGGAGTLDIGAGGLVKVGIAAQSVTYSVIVGSGNTSLDGKPTTLAGGEAVISGANARLDTNGNGLAIGLLSDGAMTISNGGSVVAGTPDDSAVAALSIGRLGNGSLTVTDAGSQLTANGGIYVGRGGTGTLTVENHATMKVLLDAESDGYLDIGNAGLTNGQTLVSGGSGSALVTTGGDLFSQTQIIVGQAGDSGSLTVNNTGTVEAARSLLIGNTVTVPAQGTYITTVGTITPTFAAAFAGTGTVTVGAGGLLLVDGTGITGGTADIQIGAGAGSTGVLTVEGTGAVVNTHGGAIVVGAAGTGFGTLNLGTGGTVIAGAVTVGSIGNVALSGGTLQASTVTLNAPAMLSGDGAVLGTIVSIGGAVQARRAAECVRVDLGRPRIGHACRWQHARSGWFHRRRPGDHLRCGSTRDVGAGYAGYRPLE
jgi:T5SS/PEP-CTERM-associated repeat protein